MESPLELTALGPPLEPVEEAAWGGEWKEKVLATIPSP
jgi:hypothetical protein